ncbi:unnamed protein product, partial [Meganyctiphanes norvegica]
CKPKKKCKKQNGKCFSVKLECKGEVIANGCREKNKCQCCVEENSRVEKKYRKDGKKYKINEVLKSGRGKKLKAGQNKNKENNKKVNEIKHEIKKSELKSNEKKPKKKVYKVNKDK